jgi:N-acetylglutamate synthase-like GNAT family acetyltransferase
VKINCKEVQHGSAEYRETAALRDRLLRKPLGLQLTPTELEAEIDSYHLACYQDDTLVACVVLKPARGDKIRMRQLSVTEQCQRQGIGTALVARAECFARELGFQEMVMHARETAVPFYERLGYEKEGERFVEVTIPHFFMRKRLLENDEQRDESVK